MVDGRDRTGRQMIGVGDSTQRLACRDGDGAWWMFDGGIRRLAWRGNQRLRNHRPRCRRLHRFRLATKGPLTNRQLRRRTISLRLDNRRSFGGRAVWRSQLSHSRRTLSLANPMAASDEQSKKDQYSRRDPHSRLVGDGPTSARGAIRNRRLGEASCRSAGQTLLPATALWTSSDLPSSTGDFLLGLGREGAAQFIPSHGVGNSNRGFRQ